MGKQKILTNFVLATLLTVGVSPIPNLLNYDFFGLPLPFLIRELESIPCRNGVCPTGLQAVLTQRPLFLVIDFLFWYVIALVSRKVIKKTELSNKKA